MANFQRVNNKRCKRLIVRQIDNAKTKRKPFEYALVIDLVNSSFHYFIFRLPEH